jgi:hypothetical protein
MTMIITLWDKEKVIYGAPMHCAVVTQQTDPGTLSLMQMKKLRFVLESLTASPMYFVERCVGCIWFFVDFVLSLKKVGNSRQWSVLKLYESITLRCNP